MCTYSKKVVVMVIEFHLCSTTV